MSAVIRSVVPGRIKIPPQVRKDVGELGPLKKSIKTHGFLHHIGVTSDDPPVLIFGYRRLLAAKSLNLARIDVRVFDLDDPLGAIRDENDQRKDLTVSEKVDLARMIEEHIGNRRGQRTDLESELVAHVPQVETGEKTRDAAAKQAGFGSTSAYRQAEKVIDQGAAALVAAVDSGDVSVSAAAEIADLPKREQAALVREGADAVKAKAKELRNGRHVDDEETSQERPEDANGEANGAPTGQCLVNGVLVDDPPDIAAKRRAGKIAPGVVPEITDDGRAEEPDAGEGEMGDDALSDEEWLAQCPVRKKLAEGVLRDRFDADALLYRALEPVRKKFAWHATRAITESGRRVRYGAFYYQLKKFLSLDHPKRWLLCPKPANEGCGGTGQIPDVGGDCPKCKGRGYWIR